ncbi:hypothetical protein [Thermococcus sp.]|uniref:hypothetical protein n=1 Tax=Thermococcus sp. TaxID=35749 RepID=UPI00261CFD47|nr:hypothetical protein [Thermococcus sp.]
MEGLIVEVKKAREIEKKAEREYRKALNKFKDPEYSDLRNLILRITVDTIFHRHLMEALEKAYEEALKLVREFEGEEENTGIALIPGVPTIVMPLGFGRIGARVPPEEVLEEYLRNFPSEVLLPEDDGKMGEFIKKYLDMERGMEELYNRMSKRAFHPVVRALAQEIKRNEEQHRAILDGLMKKYSTSPRDEDEPSKTEDKGEQKGYHRR